MTPSETPAEEANWLQTRPGERCLIRVSAEETGGAYAVVEIISSPGDGTPLHVHRNEDEYMLVVEGTVRYVRGDEMFDAGPGALISLPRNVPHAWANPGKVPLRLLMTVTPGGVEESLRVVARGNIEEMMALGARFGVEVLGPPLLNHL